VLIHPTSARLAALGLTGMVRALDEQRQAEATFDSLGFEARLALLVDREAAERDAKRLTARLKFAALRQAACVEDLDLRTPRGIDRAVMAHLIDGTWIGRHENLLVTGSTGLGKSRIACALGHKACRDGRAVACHRVPRLFETLAIARGDGRHARMLKTLARTDLLILDDWGLAVLTSSERRDLLEILEDRHGRGSTIVTSQLPVEHWHEAVGDPTLATVRRAGRPPDGPPILLTLDRLVHNAHRLTLAGESMRKRAARTKPLDLATQA
jgi:DNA replication protein DnaC